MTGSLLGSGIIHAQHSFFSGRVLDDVDGKVLEGVFITVYEGNKTVGSVYSGRDGSFSLPVGGSSLSATLLGYKVYHQELEPGIKQIEIRMSPSKLEIRPAQVQASVVEQRGDTLTFVAQAFSDGQERVLGELLQKLPGITINSSTGTVYHNGRPINKFYVEGMDLMGNRYGVVTQNLSSSRVAKVEVYQRHQPVRALQGISQSAESAVNIVLKEDGRGGWALGLNGAIGAPTVPLFSSQAVLTRFTKQSQDLFLLKGNNIGNDILRELQEQQYFGKTGSFVVDTQNADADFATELRPLRTELPLPQRYWYDNLSGLGSLNHLVKTDNGLQVKAGMSVAAEHFREQSLTREEIRLGESETVVMEEDRDLEDKRYYADLSLALDRNDAKRYLSEEFRGAVQWRDAVSALSRNNPYEQDYHLPSLKLENSFNLTSRYREDRAVTFHSEAEFIRTAHRANYTTAFYSAEQHLSESTFRMMNDVELDFRTGRLRWQCTAGTDLSYMGTRARLTGLADRGVEDQQQDFSVFSIRPNISLRSTFYLGASQWTASLPASVSVLIAQGEALLVPDFSPALSVSLRLNQAWDFSASVSCSRSHSAPESLLGVFLMQDWRTLSRRGGLRRSDRIVATAQIRYSDNLNMFFSSLAGSFTRRTVDRAAAYDYEGGLAFKSWLPVSLGSDSFSVTGRLNKYFGARVFVVDWVCTGAWTESDEYLQGRATHYLDRTLTSDLSLRLHPAGWLSAEMEGIFSLTDIRGESPMQYSTFRLEGSLSVRPLHQLSLRLLGYGLWQRIPGLEISNIPLMDASLGWQFRRFELVLECRNLMDGKEYVQESVTSWRSVSTVSSLAGRQYLVSLRATL